MFPSQVSLLVVDLGTLPGLGVEFVRKLMPIRDTPHLSAKIQQS